MTARLRLILNGWIHRVRQSPDRGSATLETAKVVLPLTALMVLFIILCQRVVGTNMDINSTASAAARAASLARSPQEAVDTAQQTAAANLASHHHTCATLTVTVDTAAFGPGGQVGVTVTCRMATSDLIGLGLPGTVSGSSTAYAVVDSYRDVAGTP
ncbi:TadE family protein [Rugosimonospora africana]|uniref:TadE-like protein n=1 Tax=Rugosimonospora africana TaxID=556532 RepID=A0A8J3VRG2_9ACTN|nr:TadE family protein [Rugosimonospora africana]GIH16104.1 hypothetical protein Raf01_42760 [Rugosimonospora africana]